MSPHAPFYTAGALSRQPLLEWRHAQLALRRWVENGLTPTVVFLLTRRFGVMLAMSCATVSPLVFLSVSRRSGAVLWWVLVSRCLKLLAVLFSVTAVLWYPVFGLCLSGIVLVSGRFDSRIARDFDLRLPAVTLRSITALWGVEQWLLCLVNVALMVKLPVDAVMVCRPFVGLGATMSTAAITILYLRRWTGNDGDRHPR